MIHFDNRKLNIFSFYVLIINEMVKTDKLMWKYDNVENEKCTYSNRFDTSPWIIIVFAIVGV